jgi:nitrate reductase assembly molybdenum cofactor insertion protein NarJ
MSARGDAGGVLSDLAEQAATWQYLHDLFRRPSDAQWEWLGEESVGEAWTLLAERHLTDGPRSLPLAPDRDAYESTYIATFDIGLPHAPCPLLESHWNRSLPAAQVLHENLLYYRQFGFEPKDPSGESPDHLLRQLEFMGGLCLLEIEESRPHPGGGAAVSVARARADYLRRHLLSWLPQAAGSLGAKMPGAWATDWVRLLSAFCQACPH